ncbi:MAG: T9SS type A sorting domain-containing protein [Bacteroidota bacterium]
MRHFTRLIACLSCAFLLTSITYAQNLYETQISVDGRLRISDVQVAADGHIYLSGAILPPMGFDSSQAVLIKLDSTLNTQWIKRYRATRLDDFAAITQLQDGNLLLTGAIRGFGSFSGGSAYKIDTAGNVLWNRLYEESRDDRIIRAFEQSNGNLLFIDRKGVTDNPTKLLNTNATGELSNVRAYEDINSNGLVIDVTEEGANGQYYLMGDRRGMSISLRTFILLTITESQLVSSLQYDYQRSGFVSDMIFHEGFIYIVGALVDPTTTISTNNAFMAKLTADGQMVWQREFYETAIKDEFFSAISPTSSTEFVVSGISREIGDTTRSLLAKIDSSGQLIWSNTYSRFFDQRLGNVQPLRDGRLLLTGETTPDAWLLITNSQGKGVCSGRPVVLNDSAITATMDTLIYSDNPNMVNNDTIAHHNIDLVFQQNDVCIISSVKAGSDDRFGITVYPNPVTDLISIQWEQMPRNAVRMKLRNAQGQALFSQQGIADELDISRLPTGLYFLEIEADGQAYHWKLVKR